MKAVRNLALALAGLMAVGTASAVWAQPIGGALFRVTSAAPLSTDTFQATFYGGQLATVTVSGSGYTNLDLYVYDEFGNLVAADTNLTDQCIVTWVPRWTGPFTIQVVNHGYVSNFYTITAS